jgi:hypothetical protein
MTAGLTGLNVVLLLGLVAKRSVPSPDALTPQEQTSGLPQGRQTAQRSDDRTPDLGVGGVDESAAVPTALALLPFLRKT